MNYKIKIEISLSEKELKPFGSVEKLTEEINKLIKEKK